MNRQTEDAPVVNEISELLLNLVESASEDRQRMLASIRSGAPQVADELERLLHFHVAAGDFLLSPIELPLTEPASHALEAGDILGSYLVEQYLGSGGSGEVYLAYDQELHRRVALKTLKPEYAADPGYILCRCKALTVYPALP